MIPYQILVLLLFGIGLTSGCGGVNQLACRDECPEAKCDIGLAKHQLPSIAGQYCPDFLCKCPDTYRVKRELIEDIPAACRVTANVIREAPTIDQIRRNSGVLRVLCEAWELSVPRELDRRGRQPRGTFQERGGWIYADPSNPSRMEAILAPSRLSRPFRSSMVGPAAIDLSSPRLGNPRSGYVLVANFHTHPGLPANGFNSDPSRADLINSYLRGVPGIVIGHDGLYTYGPSRGLLTVPSSGNPRDYPNPLLQYTGQVARRAGDNTCRMPPRNEK